MAERHMSSSPGENFTPLSQLPEFEVADDSPDVRGWSVESSDGRSIGEVDDLLVDTNLMRARYFVVGLGADEPAATRADGQVLVPVENARLDTIGHRVYASVQASHAADLPRYTGHRIERFHAEPTARTTVPPEGRTITPDATRMTRSEEELRIGRRSVPAGEVDVHKRVEREHVSRPVTTTREDVRVERHPASGDTRSTGIHEDEIRVPVTEEEIVVDKRPVVKEEVVVRKDTVTEEQNVEADVRKERIDVERPGRAADRQRKR